MGSVSFLDDDILTSVYMRGSRSRSKAQQYGGEHTLLYKKEL